MKRKRESRQGRYSSLFDTNLGFGGVVASQAGLLEVFLPFSGESAELLLQRIIQLYPEAVDESRLTGDASVLLRRYFAGERVDFGLPLDLGGSTEFQASVYRAVSRIPYGSTMSYGDVAKEIGRPRSARGVGSAMAANPLPIIIPCHRVVGASGGLTGYSGPGGVESKEWLLEMEGAVVDGGSVSARP